MGNREREQTVPTKMAGMFQGVEFTHSQFGRQYTTIEGKRYTTYFNPTDPKMKGLERGARVEFEPRPGPTVLCHSPLVTVDLPSAVLLRVEGKP
jgi:hypothetical protein